MVFNVTRSCRGLLICLAYLSTENRKRLINSAIKNKATQHNSQNARKYNAETNVSNLDPATLPNLEPDDVLNLEPDDLPNLDPDALPNLEPDALPNLDPDALPNDQPNHFHDLHVKAYCTAGTNDTNVE